jgi:creatinine amidohydrolase
MPLNPSRHWSDWTAQDFAELQASGEAARAIAVLPIAAIEQHGPHLPVSVDTTLVDGVIAACLPHLRADVSALFLPTQAVGKSNEHARYAGTLTLSAETLRAVWMELGACVARAGFGKLVLLNSHGGQVALMETVARDLRVAHGIVVVSTNWFSLPMVPAVHALFTAEEHRFGIHAGDVETSMMLALAPQTVRMEQARAFDNAMAPRAREFPLLGNGAAKLAWQVQDLNAWGAAGDATRATGAKGRAVIDDAGRQLAALLHEVDRLGPHTLSGDTAWTRHA